MKSIFAALSALIFLLGVLFILGVGLYVWAYLVISTAKAGYVVGWLVALSSFWLAYRYDLSAPWRLWFMLWSWADREIEARLT